MEAFSQLGYPTIPEPGRRIVAEEMRDNGDALPWVNLNAFARRAMHVAQSDLARADNMGGLVFFDRGLVDAAVAYEFAGGAPYRSLLAGRRHYAQRVFLAPPWPEIFVTDAERRNSLEEANAEYHRLVHAFSELGYETRELPKVTLSERVNFVLNDLGLG